MKPIEEQSVSEIQFSILIIWALKYGVDKLNSKACLAAKKIAKKIKKDRHESTCIS